MTTGSAHRRIIVGVDGSPQSRVALEWAAAEAQRAGSEVDAVLVYGSGFASIDAEDDAEPHLVFRSVERAKADLHDAIASCDLPPEDVVRINPVVALGDPSCTLCDLARSADLLVVGSRGRGGFTGLLLGSVSQRCVARSPCTVTVVPYGNASTPGADEQDPRT